MRREDLEWQPPARQPLATTRLRVASGGVRISLQSFSSPRKEGWYRAPRKDYRAARLRKMKEEQPVFKVTDRRLFNPDGTPRDVLPEEKPEEPAARSGEKPKEKPIEKIQPIPTVEGPIAASEPVATAAPATAEPAAISEPAAAEMAEADVDDAGIPDADDPASFINFAMSIASNAASSLGLMEHPVTRKREVDLELGKHWIDVLGMLQKKTHGNLTTQEAQIVEGWLADLRMQFVSLTSAPSPKAAGFTGRDIIGGK